MRWLFSTGLAVAVLVTGCGGPGASSTMNETEKKVFGDIPAHLEGTAPARERNWIPAIEEVWQKALASDLGPNHLLVVEHGVNGPQLYDAYLLYWGSRGPFHAVRAHMPVNDLENPRWIEQEVPREEGQSLLDTLGELQVMRLSSDDSLEGKVFGGGKVRFHLKLGSRENEFEVVAPYRLAKVSNKTRYREILFLLLELVPDQS